MKKLVCLVICAMLLIVFNAPLAFAASPVYSNTIELIQLFDDMGVKYSFHGMLDSDTEWITLSNRGDECTYDIAILLNSDNEEANIRVINLIEYNEYTYASVLQTINALNEEVKWAKFVALEDDNSIWVEMDLILREEDNSAEYVLEAVLHIAQIIDYAYPKLAVYAK